MRTVVFGIVLALLLVVGAMAMPAQQTSALELDLGCDEGEVVDGVGSVDCTLSVSDLPQDLPDFTLQLSVTYNDLDGSGDPSPGDQLKCIEISGPVNQTFCRDDVPEIPPPGPPAP